jgi:hypothetical protein
VLYQLSYTHHVLPVLDREPGQTIPEGAAPPGQPSGGVVASPAASTAAKVSVT